MSQLTITALDDSGAPLVGCPVTAWLSDLNGNVLREFTISGLLVEAVQGVTGVGGVLVIDLPANADIQRQNTYYSVKVGNRSAVLILKTSSAQTLLGALAVSPSALGPAALLSALGDVNLAGLAAGNGLRYQGGVWVPWAWPSGGGSSDKTWVTLSGATTLLTGDSVYRHKADASAGAFSVTLPTALGNAGLEFTVKRANSGANIVTVTTSLSQSIDGASTYLLDMQWESVTVSSDNVNWMVI
jgi:hypothetical protein